MKTIKLFEMSTKELKDKLNELKSDLFNLRFKHATNQLSNHMVMVDCKRDIAKVKTILRQRELGISFEPESKAKKAKSQKSSK